MSSAIHRRPAALLLAALAFCHIAVRAPSAAPVEAAEELEDSDILPAKPAASAPTPADSASAPGSAAAPAAVPADSAAPGAAPSVTPPAEAAGGAPSASDSGAAASVPAAAPAAAPAAVPAAAEAAGPDDLTIEVDESRSRNEGKSLPLAMLYSVVLPGAGELYLEERGRARTFLLVEAGFWASLYVTIVAKESYLQSARNYASQYAGIDAGSKDEAFLETMGSYRSYLEKQHRQDSYELSQVLQNKRERDYGIKPSPENYWDFGSSANPQNTRNWREFQSTLRYYRASKVAMSFALGALAMNRLVSMVNTLQTYKRTSARTARLDVTPDLGPDYAGTRLTLHF